MKKRYGSIVFQLTQVCNEALRISESKKDAKINQVSPYIHSWKTFKKYRGIWNKFIQFSPVRNIYKLNSNHVLKYLKHLRELGQAKKQIMTVASALKKLEVTWNRLNPEVKIDLSNVNAKEITKGLSHPKNDRAFKDPEKVIENLELARHRLAARIMFEGAARIREANHIKESQMREEYKIEVKGKGGYERKILVSSDTYSLIKAAQRMDELKEFRFSQTNFRRDLKNAALKASEEHNTPHSFRYNKAQKSFKEKSKRASEYGDTPKAAAIEIKREVSEELGHHRPDITNRYLKR